MTGRNPDKREQKKAYKREQSEQSRRWKAAEMVRDGVPYRKAAEILDRSVYFIQYWAERLLNPDGYRRVGGRRKKKYVFKKGARDLVRTRKRGPPPGRVSRRRKDAAGKILAKQKEYPFLGSSKINVLAGGEVSAPTARAVLKEAGVPPLRTVKKTRFKSFQRDEANDLWQIDYVDLCQGKHLLSVLDDRSRKVLAWEVRDTMTTEDVKSILNRAICIYGRPRQILSDHGVQWYAVNGGECAFDEWCEDKLIEHIMGMIGKPTTQGKVERWHGSLRKECRFPPEGSSAAEYTDVIVRYVKFYNSVRPHWSLDLKTPDSVYFC